MATKPLPYWQLYLEVPLHGGIRTRDSLSILMIAAILSKNTTKNFFVQLEVEERRQRRFVDNFDDGEDDDRRVDILFSTPTPMKPLFDKTCSRHTFGHPGLG